MSVNRESHSASDYFTVNTQQLIEIIHPSILNGRHQINTEFTLNQCGKLNGVFSFSTLFLVL